MFNNIKFLLSYPIEHKVAHTKSKGVDLDVETTTINAFQGREQDVVICSFVRNNLKGVLGFVRDDV